MLDFAPIRFLLNTLQGKANAGAANNALKDRSRGVGRRPWPRLPLPLFAVLILPASTLGAQAQSQTDIVTALRNGDAQGALSLAQAALKHAPRDCRLLSLEAIAFTGLHQQQPALQAFEGALAVCPEYLPALVGAAQIEYEQAPPKAIPLLERALKVQPENPQTQGMLATALRLKGNCAGALSHYRSSSVLFPDRPDLQQGYGFCLASTADLHAALEQYSSLLASRPNDTIRYDVALLQWKTHANDEALATLDPLLNGRADSAVLGLASRVHEDRSETPEAVDLLRRAILASPDTVDNYLDFTAIAFNHKSFQVGIDMLDAGLNRLPKAASLYVARGVLEVQVSKGDLAIADFQKAHALDPAMSFAVDALGIMHSQQHENSASAALFVAQAKLYPNDPLLQYLLAEELSETAQGDHDQNLQAAIAAGVRAISLDPAYKAAHDLLAVLYVRAKQPALAVQQAELALAQDPQDQDALYQEIMARRISGDREQVMLLTQRLNEARRLNGQRQQAADRYQLQDTVTQ